MSDREAMKLALEALEWAWGGEPMGTKEQAAMQALRTALAAEQPKHPGYVIGNHWLETAYSRICAGEAEADVLRDCGWERVDDAEALRRDAERYRWIRDNHEIKGRAMEIVYNSNGKEWDADIDWAMREDKT